MLSESGNLEITIKSDMCVCLARWMMRANMEIWDVPNFETVGGPVVVKHEAEEKHDGRERPDGVAAYGQCESFEDGG